ncbi:4-hydroxy-tetrahydrodipicolinate synthase [Kiritimatiella glycovorans]|uniref:4-hydroxy-tetrahydrodipicolinate synthase n=1 Tax=Kiritimatiella glycovorans TaxID=1307763 RepID=A0A0G3EE79_9BACT|nr:4-hydroxy-tetrahydrodipicolinate synthase [Kiritimatiella glycovorans]AKJ63722.1 4-hydroxy-tetrahydrodipicolinate synthase [Kiritimatiella glycovorans]
MFEGMYTALVTPFAQDGSVDYGALDRLVDAQIEGGVDGIVPVGTTGESPTLDPEEHMAVIEHVVQRADGKAKVIAGTGANSTAEALELTRRAIDLGVDGTLQVTPYYNKPSQAGLIRHFTAIADLGTPVVLYNVPGRTGREIAVPTVAELSKHPQITAQKDAGGSVDRVSEIVRECEIEVLSGDDALALPMMAVGGVGVISVAANLIPGPMTEMIRAALEGDFETALALHLRYHRLFSHMFLNSNPIPVKAALAMMGWIEEVYRLPLCEIDAENRRVLEATMREVDLVH